MVTTQDYALLSLYVYTVAEPDINRPLLPTGWTLAEPLHRDDLLGFSYGVFRSPSGEIVLAYTGTNEIIGDWASNLIAASGLVPAPQLVAAAKAYLDVKAAYGPNITLSGHSLGGGLASVVATWFDRPAVVFDAAPFQLSALSPTVWTLTGAALGLAGYSDPAFARAIIDFGIREQQVAHHYLDGEALLFLRASLPVIAGSETPLQVGGLGLSPVQLHSMALYTAAQLSPAFVQATLASERILPLVMDDKLYAFNTATSTERNFLLNLIRSEQQTPNNSKLDHFAADLNKLGTNIAGLTQAAQNALIAQGIEWYYWQGTDYAGQEFFTQTGALLQYTTALGAGLQGAQNRVSEYVRTWLNAAYTASTGDTRFAPMGTAFDQWNVSAGTAAVTATARDDTKSQIFIGNTGADTFTGGHQSDVFLAGAGADVLNGGGGYDLLYGGGGNDTLNGGAGNDLLQGGGGTDSYNFTAQFGYDTIIDSDGAGSIVVDGVTLTGGKKVTDGYWISDDRAWGYTLVDNGDLLISNASSAQHITVRNWLGNGGDRLGLVLDEAPAPSPASSSVAVFDLGTVEGNNAWYSNGGPGSATGNYTLRNAVQPDPRYTTTTSTPRVSLPSGYNGDDLIEGGAIAAVGQTVMQGNAGNDRLFATVERTLGEAIADGNTLPGLESSNYLMDGGAGDDQVVGSAGADALFGGAGNDVMVGGAGGDVIVSDGDVGSISGTYGANWVVGNNDPVSGEARTLAIKHFGARLDLSDSDSTGQRLATYAHMQWNLDVLSDIDYQALRTLVGQDVRNLGYTSGGIVLDSNTSIGSEVIHDTQDYTYLGSLIANESFNTARHNGNDVVFAGAGDDVVNAGGGNDTVHGDAGKDHVVGGAGDDAIFGGSENDRLEGDAEGATAATAYDHDFYTALLRRNAGLPLEQHGADYIDGEDGDDIIFGNGQSDVLFGGTGADEIYGDGPGVTGAFAGDDYLDGEEGDDKLFGGAGADQLEGGSGKDVLVGDAETDATSAQGDDYLNGDSGDDLLQGLGGNDVLFGGADNDLLYGDEGNDTLDGEDGIDELQGGAGDDTLYGGLGADFLLGDDGDDWLDGGDGDDELQGGTGADELTGGAGMDLLFGDDGDDRLTGAGGFDELQGGGGADTLDGGDGDDLLLGGAGDDKLTGGAGNDSYIFRSGGGNDTVIDGNGHDVLFFDFNIQQLVFTSAGTGSDIVIGYGADSVRVPGVAPGVGLDTTNTLAVANVNGGAVYALSELLQSASITIRGGAGADRLTGTAFGDLINGWEGDDVLMGGAGDDNVLGHKGSDAIYGGDGSDSLMGMHGADTIEGGEGDDTIYGDGPFAISQAELALVEGAIFYADGGNDVLFGGAGADNLIGGVGDDRLDGGWGNDQLFGDTNSYPLTGQHNLLWIPGDLHGKDVLDGGAGDDFLLGGGDADRLMGGDGNDQLVGDDYQYKTAGGLTIDASIPAEFHGDDYLDGGAGDDTLVGDGGDDTLIGGAGFDVLKGGAGNDTYVFNPGDSTLILNIFDPQTGLPIILNESIDDTQGQNRIKFVGAQVSRMSMTMTADGKFAIAVPGVLFADSNLVTVAGLRSGYFTQIETADGVLTPDQLFAQTFTGTVNETTTVTGANLVGGKNGDTLTSTGGSATFTGGLGDDTLNGTGGHNTYFYDVGNGEDTINDTSAPLDANGLLQLGTLVFGAGITSQQVVLSLNLGALRIGFGADLAGGVRLTGFDTANPLKPAGIDRFVFADGIALTHAQLVARGLDIRGGSAAETLTGTSLADRLSGGAGNDLLMGLGGADTYNFNIGDGMDVVADSDGAAGTGDTLRLGAGIDPETVQATRSGGDLWLAFESDRVTLRNFFLGGADAVERIEFANGAQWTQADVLTLLQGITLVGDGLDNILLGNGGNDTLSGLGGNDRLQGRRGADVLDGGLGDDKFVFNLGDGADVVVDAGGVDRLVLGAGITGAMVAIEYQNNDLLLTIGSLGDSVTLRDYLAGPQGASTIEQVDFADGTIWTSANLQAWRLLGTSGDDTLTGGAQNNTLIGFDGADRLDGLDGTDVLEGGAGNDMLYGGNGSDVYAGGQGEDWLSDYSGLVNATGDMYRFNVGDGLDHLYDDAGSDVIEFGFGISSAALKIWIDQYRRTQIVVNANDRIEINYFLNDTGTALGQSGIELFKFNDGTVWNWEIIRQRLTSPIQGTAASDDIAAWSAADANFAGAGGDDHLQGNTGNDYLAGDAGNDTLIGRAGSDVLVGGTGNDYMEGWSGDDTYVFGRGDGQDLVADSAGYNDRIVFGAGIQRSDLQLSSTVMAYSTDPFYGTAHLIIKLAGTADQITIDKFFVDGVDFQGQPATPTLIERFEFADGSVLTESELRTLLYTGGGNNDIITGDGQRDTITGNGGNDTLYGRMGGDMLTGGLGTDSLYGEGGDDSLDGGAGVDKLFGGTGNDTYYVDDSRDAVTELVNEGYDTVVSSITWTLSANLEGLALSGNAVINGTGNAFDNVLRGNAGANVLNGGAGADRMEGGAGNDTYVIDNVSDTIYENSSEGMDSVNSSVSYALASDIENLTLLGSAAINATGNLSNNTLTGNAGANMLDGLGGADTMLGGAGNDTYYVDNLGDVTTEASKAGTDTVISSISWTLSTELENLTLVGTANLNATGNALANVLIGNAGDNVLSGGAGADSMSGGFGNDTYVVDVATDVVTEGVNAGGDLVQSSITYTLGANVENLTLTGTTAVNGTGNTLDNLLAGNSAANVLTGGAGNDIYVVGAGDTTIEVASAGTDTVQSAITWTLSANVENLILTGAGAVNGTGNMLANVIVGNTGANLLTGGLGADTFTGGAGADIFALTAVADSGVGAGARDVITDFLSGTDKISFAGIDASTTAAGDQAFTMINTAAFSGLAGQLRYSFLGSDTVMEGDVNGDMLADFQLQLTGNRTFIAADLLL